MEYVERIQNAIDGKATDRPALGFWMHYPNQDRGPRRLAEIMVEQQKRMDLDFIKFMPYGLFSVVDWGVKLKVFAGFLDPPVQEEFPIKEPEDWYKLKPYKGTEGEYAIVLEGQRLCLDMLDVRVPFVQTVFSPLTSCAKLSGEEVLKKHIAEHPDAVRAGLEIITETTLDFALESLSRGADGLFFATQMSNEAKLSSEDHTEFVKKYDLRILNETKNKSWFNILHLHGPQVRFSEMLDYPVQAFNWHDRDDGPSMSEVRAMTDKCLLGGLGHLNTLKNGTPEEVDADIEDAWKQTGGKGIIITPGCGAATRTPAENIAQLLKSVTRLGK